MAYFKATIEILVDVDDTNEACDCIAETLRPHLKEFSETGYDTAVIDWRYAPNHSMPVEDSGEGFEYAKSAAQALAPMVRTLENLRLVWPHASDEDIERYIVLRDEGHSAYSAKLMAGLCDPDDETED